MTFNEQRIKSIIKEHKLEHREDVIKFINNNLYNLGLKELSRIAELVNNSRVDTSAYYTDESILDEIYRSLPKIDKSIIRILEPSVGIGNFLQPIIDKYSYAEKLIIEVNDIDDSSIEVLKALNKYRNIPSNVEILYNSCNFLSPLYYCMGDSHFDLVVGNPPFGKKKKKNGLSEYSMMFNDDNTKNLSGFFLQKSIEIADYVSLVMPKYFLNNPDFSITRERIGKKKIDKILDFGEKGFKGVLIETIGIFIDTNNEPEETECISLCRNIINKISQKRMMSEEFPYWLLYRNDFFDKIAEKMTFDVFRVFRDRQVTKSILQEKGDIWVIKSRNISRDGSGIKSIEGYDSFIDKSTINNLSVGKYIMRDDVYLSPNMTYYPRVIKKPSGVIVNGSVAILESKISQDEITDEHLKFLSSSTFEEFYKIARNYSTRSLNIDSNSVKFFGLYSGNNF